MSEMVERLARAIADSQNVSMDGNSRTDIYFEPGWHDLNAAVAAVQAMRTPTSAMLAAARTAKTVGEVWRAMIDEALR